MYNVENKRCKIWFQCLYCMGAQIPGTRSPWWLNFVLWRLDFEVTHTDVWKFVHLFFNKYYTYTLLFWSSCRNQVNTNTKIWCINSSESWGYLGYDAKQFHWWTPAIWRNMPPPSSKKKWVGCKFCNKFGELQRSMRVGKEKGPGLG